MSNELRVAAALDFDLYPTLLPVIRATKSGQVDIVQVVPISVLNADAGPTDLSLIAPAIEMTVSQATFPPSVSLDHDISTVSTDTVRFQVAEDEDFLELTINTTALVGTGNYDFGLTSILSGEHFFRARIERGVDFGAWSASVKHGDTTAPTITSASTMSASEGVVHPAGVLTANETVAWAIAGGADIDFYSVDAVTGEWVLAVTTDFEEQETYEVTFKATDLAGNVTLQDFTYTVLNVDEIPAAFSFTPQLGASLSTAYDSNVVTISGLAAGVSVPWTSTVAIRHKVGGIGAGVLATSGTAANDDTFQFDDIMSSASGGTSVNSTLTVGSVSGTYTVMTAGLPYSASAVLWLEPTTSSAKQNVAGSTPVTTDGQFLGNLQDLSSADNDLSAVADDTTRPLYKTSGGVNWAEFDGGDMLRKLSPSFNLGTITTGFTLAIAARVNPSAGDCLFGQGSTTTTNPIIIPARCGATTPADWVAFYRAGTAGGFTTILNDVVMFSGAFDNTDHVYVFVDTGSGITCYVDGVQGNTHSYSMTRTFSLLDAVSLMALLRTSVTGQAAGRFHGGYLLPGIVLNAAEVASATTYWGAKQGRTI